MLSRVSNNLFDNKNIFSLFVNLLNLGNSSSLFPTFGLTLYLLRLKEKVKDDVSIIFHFFLWIHYLSLFLMDTPSFTFSFSWPTACTSYNSKNRSQSEPQFKNKKELRRHTRMPLWDLFSLSMHRKHQALFNVSKKRFIHFGASINILRYKYVLINTAALHLRIFRWIKTVIASNNSLNKSAKSLMVIETFRILIHTHKSHCRLFMHSLSWQKRRAFCKIRPYVDSYAIDGTLHSLDQTFRLSFWLQRVNCRSLQSQTGGSFCVSPSGGQKRWYMIGHINRWTVKLSQITF